MIVVFPDHATHQADHLIVFDPRAADVALANVELELPVPVLALDVALGDWLRHYLRVVDAPVVDDDVEALRRVTRIVEEAVAKVLELRRLEPMQVAVRPLKLSNSWSSLRLH